MKKHVLFSFWAYFIFNVISPTLVLSQLAANTPFYPPWDAAGDMVAFHKVGNSTQYHMDLVTRTMNEQIELISKAKEGKRKVAMYIHNGMEILDFAGPTEVFTFAGFEVFTVGLTKDPIISQGVVKITPEYTIEDCPAPDIIAVFGGNGYKASESPEVIQWLQAQQEEAELMFSVCTGAFFLARAGLLDGKKATTFHNAIESLQELAPEAEVIKGVKYIDEGSIITTAGVSSGIEGALYLVQKYMGADKARETAEYMEYDCWEPN